MQDIFTTSGIVQNRIKEAYRMFGEKKDFLEVVMEIYEEGDYFYSRPALPMKPLNGCPSDDEFTNLLNQLPICLEPFIGCKNAELIRESDVLPINNDVFVFRHFNYVRNGYHMHDYFEVGYVFKGNCLLKFEKEQHNLGEGEVFIIAPMSTHDIIMDDDDSIMIWISIRKSTFEGSFFNLLSQQDLLSVFFRNIFYHQDSANYLLFFTNNDPDIKMAIKNLIMENYKDDVYHNNCCISWTNIFFSIVLRNYSNTIKFYNYNTHNTPFPLILQYIQHNFKIVSLKSLADFFHYSEAYLCTLIKKNTGMNFKILINKLKISKAVEYLENTTLSISETAECVGYNSADHFSRTFKDFHHMSPLQYRHQRSSNPDFSL